VDCSGIYWVNLNDLAGTAYPDDKSDDGGDPIEQRENAQRQCAPGKRRDEEAQVDGRFAALASLL
jgi:hypothetical protein